MAGNLRLVCRDLNLEFEIPFRELGFHGVPHRQTGFLMPSVNALVELIDMPFTVITMTEVNIVNLERVGFNLKNFDMTLVFKVGFKARQMSDHSRAIRSPQTFD